MSGDINEYVGVLREPTGQARPYTMRSLAPCVIDWAWGLPDQRYWCTAIVETRGGRVPVYDRLYGPEREM
jgi:hypothetical protein